MKFIFIKYFPSYETKVTVFSISIGTLNLLTCYFRIVNSGLFDKIIHADYFLSMEAVFAKWFTALLWESQSSHKIQYLVPAWWCTTVLSLNNASLLTSKISEMDWTWWTCSMAIMFSRSISAWFFWSLLKDIIFVQAPTTKNDMKERMSRACQKVIRNLLLSSIQHYVFRLQRYIDVERNAFLSIY